MLDAKPMSVQTFEINRWSARAGGLSSTEDWVKWTLNPWIPRQEWAGRRELVPPAVHRRASRLSRLALEAALSVAQDQNLDYGVFASRHGEIEHTLGLMEAISKNEELSPMAFSQSVHNVAAGLFTIIQNSHTKVTSICAGPETFDMALLEAYSFLKSNPLAQILVVYFDQKLPDHYQKDVSEPTFDFALALLLSQGETSAEAQVEEPHPGFPRSLQFMKSLVKNNSTQIIYSTELKRWRPV